MAAIQDSLEVHGAPKSWDLPTVEAAGSDGLLVDISMNKMGLLCVGIDIQGLAAGADSQIQVTAQVLGLNGAPANMTGAGALKLFVATGAVTVADLLTYTSGSGGNKSIQWLAVPGSFGRTGVVGFGCRLKLVASAGADAWTSGTIKMQAKIEAIGFGL